MPAGGEHEAFLTADYNAEMIEHIERYPAASATARSSSATPTTSSRRRFGPGLPEIRDWTERHYEFAGYVPGFDPRDAGRSAEPARASSATATSRCASSRSAAPASARRCCGA